MGAANAKIFAAVPQIAISVLDVFVDEAKRTAVCEILVHLNDHSSTVLKVVDVIVFAPPEGSLLLIKSVRAYKG